LEINPINISGQKRSLENACEAIWHD
jgi:hypothetical protein